MLVSALKNCGGLLEVWSWVIRPMETASSIVEVTEKDKREIIGV